MIDRGGEGEMLKGADRREPTVREGYFGKGGSKSCVCASARVNTLCFYRWCKREVKGVKISLFNSSQLGLHSSVHADPVSYSTRAAGG